MTQASAVAQANTHKALDTTALAMVREAKLNAGKGGTHKYGTPTPASPGGPPALISGALRRAITKTPITAFPGGFECRVGVAAGVFPTYGKTRTPADQYGSYLEKGLRNGAKYPFLTPAFHLVAPRTRGIAYEQFHGFWPHV